MLVPARVALVFGSLALLVGGSLPANADSDSARSEVVGHVYVNDNTAPANSIGAFDRHANGRLTPMNGSPFTIGGAGTGTIVGSQGALQVSHDGYRGAGALVRELGVPVVAVHEGGYHLPTLGSLTVATLTGLTIA